MQDSEILLTLTYKMGAQMIYPNVCPFLLVHGANRGVPRRHPALGRPYSIHLQMPARLLNDPYIGRFAEHYQTIIHPKSASRKLRITIK